MKKVLVFTTLMVLALASRSFALYNIMDGYAAETLLNKPEITGNLDFMRQANNVSLENEKILYRSHYDERVGVILEDINEMDLLKGLSVRLQLPVEIKVRENVYSRATFKEGKIDDIGADFLKSLGYTVGYLKSDIAVEEPKPPVVPVPQDPPDRVRDEGQGVVGGAGRIDDYKGVAIQKGNIGITFVQYEGDYGVEFILNITDSNAISDEVKADLRKMADFYGFAGLLEQIEANMEVYRFSDFSSAIELGKERYDFASAMKTELNWLKDNGIIAGITDEDIAAISELSKMGMSGWNSRISYSEGKWLPYYDGKNPVIIRILMEDQNAQEVDIPPGAATFSTTSVSAKNKLNTQWGSIKTQ